MGFQVEMAIANKAKIVGWSDSSLAVVAFAYILWFFFDYSLEDDDNDVSWYGELYLETSDPNGFDAEETRGDCLVLCLNKTIGDGEEEFEDSLTMPISILNPLTMLQAAKRAHVVAKGTLAFPRRSECAQSMDELWQEFFSTANGFFADEGDSEAKDFEKIMDELLQPDAKVRVMEELRKHLVNFKWGEMSPT